MVVPEYQDGKSEEAFIHYTSFKYPDLENEDNTKSRKAGGQQQQKEDQKKVIPKIIVDMREFRSDLPCLIHRRGLEVVPVTISVSSNIRPHRPIE